MCDSDYPSYGDEIDPGAGEDEHRPATNPGEEFEKTLDEQYGVDEE